MPLIPGQQRLGQGIPGGRAGLPGELTLPGGGGGLGTIPLPGATRQVATNLPPSAVSAPSPLGPAQQQTHSGPTITEALAILDRVRQRKLSVNAARNLLAGMDEASRQSIAQMLMTRHSKEGGQPPIDELKVLVGDKGKVDDTATTPGGIVGNLFGDVKGFVKGFPAGVGILGKDLALDTVDRTRNIPANIESIFTGEKGPEAPHRTWDDIIAPTGKAMNWQYGPLVHGDVGEFGHRLGEHPLGPVLDLAGGISGGLGAVGRVGNASRALQLGKVERLGAAAPKTGIAGLGHRIAGRPYNLGHLGGGAPPGPAVVGGRYYVNELKNGTYSVRDSTNGQAVGQGFPDEATAIKHAQSISTGGISGDRYQLAIKGAIRKGPQGSLIDAWDRARNNTHEQELTQIMQEVADVLDDPNLKLSRRSFKEVRDQVYSDLKATRAKGRTRPHDIAEGLPGFVNASTTGRALSAGATALREASDLVRAGAVYLRGAYLPNNWAGNEFMNIVQQGVFAPVNLSKSLVMDKHIGPRYTKAIDASLGQTPAEAVISHGPGYVSSLTKPLAHTMGAIADTPFRRAAWLHEARRMGYRKLSDVKELLDRASMHGTHAHGEEALRQVAEISRRASEEIGKFGHMNDVERGVLRHLVFVYSWMRAAGRYSARFPMHHPIQSAIDQYLSQVGTDYNNANLGGVPSFLIGSVPVGHDSKGNPILINPFSLNPLGTGLQEAEVAAGTLDVLRNPRKFNKFAQTDIISLLNPVAQNYLQAREGGKSFGDTYLKSIAAIRLAHDLQHPGSGSIFPTTRKEAIGHFMVGGLYPRQADQGAITRALQRENASNPAELIPEQLKQYKKATGQDIPDQLISAYRADLDMIDELRTFQRAYADKHGQSGFRNLPPENKVEAALEFLDKYSHIPDEQMASLKQSAGHLPNDAVANDFANSLFAMTAIGSVKRSWDELMRNARGLGTTRKRQ